MENKSWLKMFHREVRTGSIDSVTKIINTIPPEVNIDAPIAGHKMTALECLVYKKKPSKRDETVMSILLNHGANPLRRRRMPYPVFYLSFQKFGSDTVIELLERLEDIDIPLDPKKKNALHLSALHGKISVMKYCLARGADPNKPFHHGLTAIYLALLSPKNRERMVKLLIQNGADINARMEDELTVLHLILAYQNCEKMINTILKFQPDMNLTESSGFTPLHFFLMHGTYNLTVLENLLENGSDPNFPAVMGCTALHFLVTSENEHFRTSNVSDILIKYGASVNCKDHLGNTPLHYAVSRCCLTLVQSFLDNGADISIKNQEGKTVLELVDYDNLTNVASILVKHVILLGHMKKIEPSIDISDIFNASSVLRELRRQCKEELDHMKNRVIGDTRLNFLTVLKSSTKEVSRYVRKEETRSILADSRASDYLHYGKLLRKKITAGIRMRRLELHYESILLSSPEFIVPPTITPLIVDALIDYNSRKRHLSSKWKA